MPRITKVYTRTGDDGTTSLGSGRRVPKDAARIEAYGAVDEINSFLGAALASGLDSSLAAFLQNTQNDLFHLGSDLCVSESDKQRLKVPQIEQRHIDALESFMDRLSNELAALENFILPGGSAGAVWLHVARSVCRRAERRVYTLSRQEPVGAYTIKYLNRLSDTLFVMARYENLKRGVADIYWNSRV